MMNQNTPIDEGGLLALAYIDDAARQILNESAQHEDFPDFDADDYDAFQETFQDGLEPAAAGAPITIFPNLTDELISLIYDLISARIYQLLFATGLTEGTEG